MKLPDSHDHAHGSWTGGGQDSVCYFFGEVLEQGDVGALHYRPHRFAQLAIIHRFGQLITPASGPKVHEQVQVDLEGLRLDRFFRQSAVGGRKAEAP
jgi:hypothetical protein